MLAMALTETVSIFADMTWLRFLSAAANGRFKKTNHERGNCLTCEFLLLVARRWIRFRVLKSSCLVAPECTRPYPRIAVAPK